MLEKRMTVKEVYENILRELNKTNSPSLHLEDYNYFMNKAITEYINTRYNIYDTSQQTTDDLQVLTSTVNIKTKTGVLSGKVGKGAYDLFDGSSSIVGNQLILTLNSNVDSNIINPVYKNGQSNVGFTIERMSNVPDTPQLTVMFILVNTATSFTFKHTDRSVAVPGDMVLLGGADSILSYVPQDGSTSMYTGKTFLNESGILIEVPFSGQGEKSAYIPKTTIKNNLPQTNFKLPVDYYHTLNCVVNFKVIKTYLCYPKGTIVPKAARRMTADLSSGILDNAYMRPDYRRPYFYIQNQFGTGIPELEIRAGDYTAVFEIDSIDMDYLKIPQVITLTTTQRDSLNDTSQVMEFPNYVSQEIIKTATKLLLENSSDPRLQANAIINQSIPSGPPVSPTAQHRGAAQK